MYTAINGGARPLTSSPRFKIAITMVNHHKAKKVHPGPKLGTHPITWVLNISKYIVYPIYICLVLMHLDWFLVLVKNQPG
jgi:hypothetical protein